MKDSALLSIDEIGDRVTRALEQMGWRVWMETDSPRDFKHIIASNEKGLLEAFTRMEVILMALGEDPNDVDLIFYFYADPSITGKGTKKRAFGKKARENDADVFRKFCDSLLQLAPLEVELLNWDCESSPYSPRIRFDPNRDEFERPAYRVTLYYWKEPLKESVQGYLAPADREALIKELKEILKEMGLKTQWRDPVSKMEMRELHFYIKQDLLKGMLHGLLEYELPYAEVRVEFDRLGVLFSFDKVRSIKDMPLADIEAELRKRLKPVTDKFPEVEFCLEEFLDSIYFRIRAIFPISERERLLALLDYLGGSHAQ